MNSQFHSNEPDPDAIKMFAGQIPRYMDENDLQKLFEEFGPVYQINVLRDKVTNQSKGEIHSLLTTLLIICLLTGVLAVTYVKMSDDVHCASFIIIMGNFSMTCGCIVLMLVLVDVLVCYYVLLSVFLLCILYMIYIIIIIIIIIIILVIAGI